MGMTSAFEYKYEHRKHMKNPQVNWMEIIRRILIAVLKALDL